MIAMLRNLFNNIELVCRASRGKVHPMSTDTQDDDRRGIQSIEVGGRLLKAAAAQGQAMPLKALSQAADMSAEIGRAHV